MDKTNAQRLLTVRAVTSVKTLRDKSVAWLKLAVNRLEHKEEDGRNIIERAIDRLYFAPAQTPDMQEEAMTWYTARQSEVAASASAAILVGRKAAAEAAAAKATADSGGDAVAVAAAVTAAYEAYDALHQITQATSGAALPPSVLDPLAVPAGLLDALAAHERAYQESHILTAPADRNKSGKRRPGIDKGVASAAEIAEAARVADDIADVARTVEDVVDGDSTEDDDDVIAEAPVAKLRKRKATLAPQKPAAKVAARAVVAATAAASSQYVGDCGEDRHSDDDDNGRQAQVSSRRRTVGDTAAPRVGRSKEENKIPRLWAQLQDAATRGRVETFAVKWSVVFTATRAVIESLLEGDENDVARALLWEKALAGMQGAYDLGAAIALYSVV